MNKKQQPFFNPELSGFCSQMAMILHSGISPLEGITIMLEDSTSDREKDILRQILDTLQETADFSLFEKRPCLLSYHRNEWDTTFGKCKKRKPEGFWLLWISFLSPFSMLRMSGTKTQSLTLNSDSSFIWNPKFLFYIGYKFLQMWRETFAF